MITKHEMLEKIGQLSSQKMGMVEYLKLKISQEDWHGVADAAMDIREIEARLSTINSVLEYE